MINYDVIIVGAGPAGLFAANELSPKKKVLLIDAGVDLSEGIWLGNNISNQFTLKVTTNSRILRAEIEPGFGYTIKRGSAILTKFLSE